MAKLSTIRRQKNFGGNLTICPRLAVAPRCEAELLDFLAQCKGRKIRVVGRLHSWSDAPAIDDVLVDLRHFDQVAVEKSGDGYVATLGGGCQIKRALAELSQQAGATLPTLGLISEQSIAGAISTGTHGSGKHCLSHYLTEVRLASYDPQSGQPIIRTISNGVELQAAKCSIGCLGVIVAVKIGCRARYNIEEFVRFYSALDEVLAAERDYPLQQFYLLPWLWKFVGQHRREVDAPRSRRAAIYRVYWYLTIDLALHLIVKLLVQVLNPRRGVKFFYRHFLSLFVVRNWRVIDDSNKMLIMEHELFRHIEIEVFVRLSNLSGAVTFAREILESFSGNSEAVSNTTAQQLERLGLFDELMQSVGSYSHHYAICIRRVLPDDTLISMSSGGDEPYYALSFISYARPSQRDGFFKFAKFLAASMAALFEARPHWGKVCPLDREQIQRLYPRLPEFQRACQTSDPDGVFRNSWLENTLFPASYS
ncbi:MAG: FAD-binding protein [Pirellulales bacterium]|nr:FAD-binding protein [Pirellulales bacterium]